MKTCASQLAILLVVLFAGAGASQSGHPRREIVLGQPFDLELSQSAVLVGRGFVVRFASVAGDSRCPKDVICIWEGSADLVFVLKQRGAATATTTLRTSRGPGEAHYLGYVLRLLKVEPYPRTAGPKDWSQYVATVVLTRET